MTPNKNYRFCICGKYAALQIKLYYYSIAHDIFQPFFGHFCTIFYENFALQRTMSVLPVI